MMNMDEQEHLPLPSEDVGDLVTEPRRGETDNYLVAQEEGVPWVPPMDRVLSETRLEEGGADEAGTAPSDAEELERVDMIQQRGGGRPRDDELLADVLEALRASDLPAGDHLEVAVDGRTVWLRGEVESLEVLWELLGLVGDVPGVDDVQDEVKVLGA